MASTYLRGLTNAVRSDSNGASTYDRVFMCQKAGTKDCIQAIGQLENDEPDFILEDIAANVEWAVKEHVRLSQILTSTGVWRAVDVDIKRNHLRWFEDDTVHPLSSVLNAGIDEESNSLRDMLQTMPAFKDTTGMTPRWQVLASRRKLILHIHHQVVDGMSLAMMAGSLFMGYSLDESINAVFGGSASSPKIPPPASRLTLRDLGSATKSTVKHTISVVKGFRTRQPAIANNDSEARVEDITNIHVGPFSVPALKAEAKRRNDTLNCFIAHCITMALKDYCGELDNSTLRFPLRAAVPVSFKKLSAKGNAEIQADNNFAAVVVKLSNPEEEHADGAVSSKPVISSNAWTKPKALGAWAATSLAVLLPPPLARGVYRHATRDVDFVFSNVNGSGLAKTFVSKSSGKEKRLKAYIYGSLNGVVRLFVMASSHGEELHLGLTVDQTIVKDRHVLARCLQKRLSLRQSEQFWNETHNGDS